MESINDYLLLVKRNKDTLNKNISMNDSIILLSGIVTIYDDIHIHYGEVGDTDLQTKYLYLATNLRVLLSQLNIQNEALIKRMKGLINE